MQYMIYIFSGILSGFFLAIVINPKNGKKGIYYLFYLLPFWVWGVVFMSISTILWYVSRGTNFMISNFHSPLFFLSGILILFTPNRKIKKSLERVRILSDKKVKMIASILLVFSISMLLSL